MSDCAKRGPIAINDVVYAEFAAGFAGQAQLHDEIAAMRLKIAPCRRRRCFSRGKSSAATARAGARTNVLADFFIGAEASAEAGRS